MAQQIGPDGLIIQGGAIADRITASTILTPDLRSPGLALMHRRRGDDPRWAFSPFPYHAGAVWVGGALAGRTTLNGVWRIVPFYLQGGYRIASLGVIVSTATASGLARAAIYANVSNDPVGDFYPGALLADSGDVSATTTGIQNAAINLVAPYTGLYWGAVNTNLAAIGLFGPAVAGIALTFFGTQAAGTQTYGGGTLTAAFGPPPNPFPNGAALETAASFPCTFMELQLPL